MLKSRPRVVFVPLAAAGVTLIGACATIPDAPAPVVVDATPSLRAPEAEPEPLAPAIVEWTPEPPLLEWYPSIEWTPADPRQADAIVIRLALPAGAPDNLAIGGDLAGRDLRFVRRGSHWFGVGGLPIDSAGFTELRVRFEGAGVDKQEIRLIRVRERRYESTQLSVAGRGEMEPETQERIRREAALIRGILTAGTEDWLAVDGFEWPRPPAVTSPFGQRRVFNGEVRSRHLGTDFRGNQGGSIEAPGSGRIALVGDFFYQGNAVYIDHGLGVFSGLFHMSRIEVREGDLVNRGQVVGRVGSTGRSTAPHLHWSAYVGGQNVDPGSLLDLRMDEAGRVQTAADREEDG